MNWNLVPNNTLFIAYCFFLVSSISWIFIPVQLLSQSSPSLHHQKKCSLFSLLPEATIVKLPPLLHKHWSDLMQMSLEGMMLKLKLQYFGHLMQRVDSLEKTLMLGGIAGRRRRGRQRIRWFDGITDSMTWVWVNSGSWWWTGRPGMLQFIGSQRVGHNWATELNWTELMIIPYLTFWGAAELFSTTVVPFYIHTAMSRKFYFLHILTKISFLLQQQHTSHVHTAHIPTLMLHLYIELGLACLEMFVHIMSLWVSSRKMTVERTFFFLLKNKQKNWDY